MNNKIVCDDSLLVEYGSMARTLAKGANNCVLDRCYGNRFFTLKVLFIRLNLDFATYNICETNYRLSSGGVKYLKVLKTFAGDFTMLAEIMTYWPPITTQVKAQASIQLALFV